MTAFHTTDENYTLCDFCIDDYTGTTVGGATLISDGYGEVVKSWDERDATHCDWENSSGGSAHPGTPCNGGIRCARCENTWAFHGVEVAGEYYWPEGDDE